MSGRSAVVWVLAVMLLAAVACVGGCGGGSEEESQSTGAEEGAGTSTPAAGETFTVTSDEGTATITSTGEGEGTMTITGADGTETVLEVGKSALPKGFPEDFPVYEAKTLSGGKSEESESITYVVELETSDSVSKVADWYKNAIVEKGYKVTSSMTVGEDTSMVAFEKGNLSGIVTVNSSDGKTGIAITLQESK